MSRCHDSKFLDLKTLSRRRRPLHCQTMEKYGLETLYSKKENNFTFNHVVSSYANFLQQMKAFKREKFFIYFWYINISAVSFFSFLYNSRHSKLCQKLGTCVGCLRASIAKLHNLQGMIHLACLRLLKTTLQYQTNLGERC